jgi:hypothetical protein
MESGVNNFGAFWPHYLMAHRSALCRTLHHIGMSGAVAGSAVAIVRVQPLWFATGVIFAYAVSWVGHFWGGHNRPATFGHPLWSVVGDVRMYLLWLSGGLSQAIDRAAQDVGSVRSHR